MWIINAPVICKHWGRVGNSGANLWGNNLSIIPAVRENARVITSCQNSWLECWLEKYIKEYSMYDWMELGPRGRGTKSRTITISLSPQCRDYNWALRNKKFLSPLFRIGVCGGGGVVVEMQWLKMTGAYGGHVACAFISICNLSQPFFTQDYKFEK